MVLLLACAFVCTGNFGLTLKDIRIVDMRIVNEDDEHELQDLKTAVRIPVVWKVTTPHRRDKWHLRTSHQRRSDRKECCGPKAG